jgi:hypothetical protein
MYDLAARHSIWLLIAAAFVGLGLGVALAVV